jgi:hypothetical protein
MISGGFYVAPNDLSTAAPTASSRSASTADYAAQTVAIISKPGPFIMDGAQFLSW